LANTSAPSATIASLIGAGDDPHQRLPPRLDGTQAQIVPIKAQKVEGHERGLRSAALGHERAEVAPPVLL